jgi:hypothetical protein
MVWTDVSYGTLRQLVIGHEDENTPTCLNNPLVAEQIIQGYVARQVLGIRRLLDKTSGVISLRRLITDMCSNWSLFTRENYVCHDGLPYDYEAVMLKEFRERAGNGLFGRRPQALKRTGPRATRMSSSTASPGSIRANAGARTACRRLCSARSKAGSTAVAPKSSRAGVMHISRTRAARTGESKSRRALSPPTRSARRSKRSCV